MLRVPYFSQEVTYSFCNNNNKIDVYKNSTEKRKYE